MPSLAEHDNNCVLRLEMYVCTKDKVNPPKASVIV